MSSPCNMKRYVFPVALFIFSANTFAAGFQLWEESAASLGDYHAGGAAEANNASSVFYNPAGMVRIKHQQISVGAAFVDLNLNYTGSVSTDGFFRIPSPNNTPGGTFNVVPNFHYVLPINNRWAFAIEETTPFGLSTNYKDTTSSVGFLATKTELQTFNLNPSFAYALNHYFSLGAGFDVMYGAATYDDNYGPWLGPLNSSLKGYGYGYNLGALMQFTPETRLGLSYRSSIIIPASGSSTGAILFGPVQYLTASADFPVPATTMLSVYHDMTHRWAMMASAFYTQWSIFNHLIIHNLATPSGPGTIDVFENYRDTWNLAIGTRYRFTRFFALEGGFGHDETPTKYNYRDIRLPDADRYAASIGINVHPTHTLELSAGWTHFFVKTVPVNNSASNGNQTSPGDTPAVGIGNVNGSVNVFGAQLTWDI